MKISILSGPYEGNSYNFEYNITIGRDNSVDLSIPLDLAISRKHLNIFIQNKSLVIEDLNSTNGTFIIEKNLEKISLIKLKGKKEFNTFPLFIKVGNTVMEIVL
jgi:pSer/pThr/pTyr-binding forkhead associated (FHA) protein